jgi:hypothetical protein|tara:strand:+ start:12762 stop:12989 length:228 start_codon:yes stop_codon:yes gene_type:complete
MDCNICNPLTLPPVFLTNPGAFPSLFAHPTAKNGSREPSTPNTAMVNSKRPATKGMVVHPEDVEGSSSPVPGTDP